MIFREGKNCWRCPEANKISFLIDGADYFETLADAFSQARKTIFIAGWDIDSRLILNRRRKLRKTPPVGFFLNQIAEKNKSLNIYILVWDYYMMYLAEREWLPMVSLGWKTHRRIHFHLDNEHPLGGSQHVKIVVIDDILAFCGGLDLTTNRWDTNEHRVKDRRRRDFDKRPYAPFHDVQMAVAGDAAGALGELYRDHWQNATGQTLPAGQTGAESIWPGQLKMDISFPVRVAVARTLPSYKGRGAVREIEQLYIEAITAARHRIFIENQYLTAQSICQALERRLAQSDPPEIVLIMPQKASGWLEQSTLDALRRHQLTRLKSQDHKKMLSVYYPLINRDMPVYIHSKLMIVDDRIVIVGSANLTNRSMGLDSECCLALEGETGSEIEAAVKHFRRRFMAEHTGVSIEEFSVVEKEETFIRDVVEKFRKPERSLEPLDGNAQPIVDGTLWITDQEYLDPKEPFMLDRMIDYFTRDSRSLRQGMVQLLIITGFLLSIIILAAVWQWTPLAGKLAELPGLLHNRPILMLIIVIFFVLGGLVFIPVTLMVGATILILPPWQSFVCALSGAVLSAGTTYLAGRKLKKQTVRRLAGRHLDRLKSYFVNEGILTIVIVRNLPVAPYTVVNIIAGYTGIRFSQFMIGTGIGLLPGILAITIFADRLFEAIKRPEWPNVLFAGAVAGLMGLGFWWLTKRLKFKSRRGETG